MKPYVLLAALCAFAGGFLAPEGARGEENSPANLHRLVRGKSTGEAVEVSNGLMKETIRMDDDEVDIRRRVAILSAVLITGVSRDGEESLRAVAAALAQTAGPELEREIIATFALLASKLLPEAGTALEAALEVIPDERRAAARQAAEDPKSVLGLRLRWAVGNACRDTLKLMDAEDAAGDPEAALSRELSATGPSTTTTTTTTTTTSTTRPSPTPVGRR